MTGSITATTGSWRVLFGRRHGAFLATFSLGSALYAFSAFLVSAAMPSAVQQLGHLNLISWGFTFYLIAAIIAGTVASSLKQRWGAQATFQYAGVAFLLGTLACGFAPTIWALLFGRALQGVGEGTISGLSYILIPEMFPAVLIPAVFGVEAVIWAVGSMLGPMLGGVLTQAISWRAAFLVEVPMILVFMLLVRLTIPRVISRVSHQALPMLRLGGVGLGILLLSLAAIEPALWMRVVSVVAALALLTGLVARDRHAPNRLLPRDAFSLRTRTGLAFWVVLLMPTAHTGPGVYLIFILERVWGYDPLTASFLGAAMVVAWSAVAIVVSRLPPRLSRSCLWVGPLMLALGLGIDIPALMAQQLVWLLVGQAFVGIAYGLTWGFLSQTIMTGALPGDRDRASGMLPTVLSAGLAIGAALGGVAANAAGLVEGAPMAVVIRAGLVCFVIATALGLVCVLMGLLLRARTTAFATAKTASI
jgi:MFS family permease